MYKKNFPLVQTRCQVLSPKSRHKCPNVSICAGRKLFASGSNKASSVLPVHRRKFSYRLMIFGAGFLNKYVLCVVIVRVASAKKKMGVLFNNKKNI